jgi:hypothetical protein
MEAPILYMEILHHGSLGLAVQRGLRGQPGMNDGPVYILVFSWSHTGAGNRRRYLEVPGGGALRSHLTWS